MTEALFVYIRILLMSVGAPPRAPPNNVSGKAEPTFRPFVWATGAAYLLCCNIPGLSKSELNAAAVGTTASTPSFVYLGIVCLSSFSITFLLGWVLL